MTTTLLTGGRIHSPADPHATAMATADGVVVWLGQDSVGLALHGDADEHVRLDGAFVAPAFVDAHVHATSAGLLRTGLDLTAAPTLTAALDALAAHVRRHGRAAVWGHGWDETTWPERRPPTRAEIDRAADGAPVYLSRVDVHSAVVSTALLERAGLTADGDGPLTRDAHHQARRAARDAITAGQRHDAQLAFLRHAASMGVAAVHECAGPDISGAEDLAALLAIDGDLPHVVAYWGERADPAIAATHRVRGLAGDLFVDGALGSRTAALHAPYTDAPDTSGALYLDPQAIGEHLAACTRAGVQAGFHVIGDAATAAVIAGFAEAERQVGRLALAAARHRLEHLEMVTAEQAAQLAAWGVVASVQPQFDAHWGGPDGMYAQRLGPDRGTALNPFAQLAAAGVVLALGSDAPVTAVDPWASVRAAVHHRTDGHGLSPRAAFTAHTRGGWRAAGVDDGLTGTLQPGAPATYAIWDAPDLVTAAPDSRVQRWSTDPRSRVPALPRLDPGATLPVCQRTVLAGRTLHDRQEDHAPA